MKRIHFILLAALTLTACDEPLPAGDKTSVYFWSEVYLNKYADKLTVGDLEEGPEPLKTPRVVLLITGVTIAAEWFDPIVARLERDGFKPVVYEPPALLSGDLFQATYDLAEVVEQVRADSGQEKIDILAECTGGVVARHYIQSHGGDELVARLVTFVSPHKGIDKAPWAALIAGWPALYDLSPGSAFLNAVNSVPLPENVPFTSIYTCTDEYIRPIQTSIVEGANNIGLCDGFVGHFQTFYDPEIYLIMHGALTEPTGIPALDDVVEPEVEEEPDVAVDPAPEQVAAVDVVVAGETDEYDASLSDPISLHKRAEQGAGCSSTGRSGSPWAFMLLLGGMALVRRRRLV